MKRNAHAEFILEIINSSIPKQTKLILNADDPLTSMYGYKREKRFS